MKLYCPQCHKKYDDVDFEMLTGHLPFQVDSGLQVLMNHIQRPPPDLEVAYPGMIPREVTELVADLLEKPRFISRNQ